MSEQIARWRPIIHQARLVLRLSADTYPDDVVLALIEVESAGDASARRLTRVRVLEGSAEEPAFWKAAVSEVTRETRDGKAWLVGRVPAQFCGLLQMGKPAGQDVGFDVRGFRGWDTTAPLLGDGLAAITAFLAYQERYRARHCYQPSRIAYLWKAGPGSLKRANKLAEDTLDQDAAFETAAAENGVPNAMKYLRRFRVALEVYSD